MDNQLSEFRRTERLWQRIALIAGSFSFILCVMIIVNFFQVNRDDPVSTKVMDQLVERLHQDPSDDALREQIRALDLVARKAYFTSRWQIRTGGYLLLIGVAVVIISMQVIMANRKKEPFLTENDDEDLLKRQQITRRWISAGGSAVVVIALLLAYFSHRNLQDKFQLAASPATTEEIGDQDVETNDREVDLVVDSAKGETVLGDSILLEEDVAGNEVITERPAAEEVKSDVRKAVSGQKVADKGEMFANFRGPGGNGVCIQKNVPVDWDGPTGKNIKWKVKVPLPGFNSPIVYGDRVFLAGADENRREVYAFDRHSGEILWTTALTGVPGSPAQAPEVANYTGHSAPTMATDGNLVFAVFSNGDMAALDLDGNVAWSRNLGVPVNHYGYSSSLIVYKDKVIIQYDQKNGARLMAMKTKDGEEAWAVKREVKISWSSPVIVNTGSRDELLTVADPLVISYNPNDGSELWRIEGVTGEVGPSLAFADGIVFAVNDYSRLVAIKAGNPVEVIWEDEEYLSDVPSPVATKDYLFMPTSYGMVACYETKTGEKLWEYEVGNTIYASPLIVEGKVYLVDKQGVTHIFKAAREFASLGTPALGEKIVCTPAFADGNIYLRGYENLYCIGN